MATRRKSAGSKATSRGSRGGAPRPTAIRPGGSNEQERPRGKLMIIGGHEDKEGDRLILTALARHVGHGKLVVATVASEQPDELWKTYHPLFKQLGVREVAHLDVGSRQQAKEERSVSVLDGATGVFFNGGDQLKITSQLGDSPIYERIHEIYRKGGVIAGTSAGASVMAETMMVSGEGDASSRIGDLRMAPGFGLLPGVIIDQHFAERGRIGRLIGAVAQNPRIVGVGIDEDTAIVCAPERCFEVIGAGAVYVLDGADITDTNLTAEATDRTLSVYGIRLHVLTMGDVYLLASREPKSRPADEVKRELVGTAAD